MRRFLLVPLLLTAATACNRSHAPATASQLAPAAAGVEQSVPAGGMPAPSASVAGPATAIASRVDEPKAALAAPRSDARWRDVPPEEPDAKTDPELAAFQADQRRRDAELMAQDAEEAERQRDGDGRIARDDERDPRYRDPRYADSRYRDPRSRDPRYRDPREEGRYPDDRYAERDRYGRDPYDRGGYYGEEDPEAGYDDPYAEPQPWEEDEESYEPYPDEDYDPRYDDPYRR